MYNNIFVKIIMMPINLYIKCFSSVLNFGYKYINFDNKKTYVVYLYSKCVSSSSMQLCPIATDFYPDFIYLIYQWSAPFSIQKKNYKESDFLLPFSLFQLFKQHLNNFQNNLIRFMRDNSTN